MSGPAKGPWAVIKTRRIDPFSNDAVVYSVMLPDYESAVKLAEAMDKRTYKVFLAEVKYQANEVTTLTPPMTTWVQKL